MKYFFLILIAFFAACKKDSVKPKDKDTPPAVIVPDSIRYVVTDAGAGCTITYDLETGLPKQHQVMNETDFEIKVKAITGTEYVLFTQNSGQTTAKIYLNDSLICSEQSAWPDNETWQSFNYQ